MIILEELKPILEPLLDGRDDSVEVMEKVIDIDKEATADHAEIERINAEWQTKLDAAIEEAKKDKEETIKRMFFGPKGDYMDTTIPTVTETETKTEMVGNPDTEEVTGENITIDDLFEEKIID